MIDQNVFKSEEKAVFALRSLYRKYGYLPFKMSKFEEYEFYIRNKDFLVSDRIITFNDINGKLLALKPDVTLSIIKNGEDLKGVKQKVFYNENVYRATEARGQFKEILQAGLECIGDIDLYDIYEVVALAAESLALISNDFVLEISHLGVLSAALDYASSDSAFKEKAIHFIADKNSHDLLKLCNDYDIDNSCAEMLTQFISIYGERSKVISELKVLCGDFASEQLKELENISNMLETSEFSDKILFDFSVVNDMNYYNGIVFKGFLSGISEGILAGGQYDKMMRKLDRKSGAVGFAVYLNLLEQLKEKSNSYNIDVLLIYDAECGSSLVAKAVKELVENGNTVTAQKEIPANLRYKKLVKLGKDGDLC